MGEVKNFWQSKKLWAGVLILLSGIAALLTGEKSLDANTIAELVLALSGLVQTILAIIEGNPTVYGNYVLGNNKAIKL